MRDLSRENYKDTIIIIKERPTIKTRQHLTTMRTVLNGIRADVIFRSDITDALIHSLSDYIKTENEQAFWKEIIGE